MRCHQVIPASARALVLFVGFTIMAPAVASAEDYAAKQTCGGRAVKKCSAGLFCENAPGMCQGADIEGTCVGVPRFCTKIFLPVCGCDGKTHGNDCDRQAAMVSKDHDGACKKS